MQKIRYIERSTSRECIEQVYGEKAVRLVYGDGIFSRFLFKCILPFVDGVFSKVYGYLQKTAWSRKKIRPFINAYQIDESEFTSPTDSFGSFNDFFIRKLKPACRPIASDPNKAVLPADARYLAYQNVSEVPGFFIKGQTFSLETLLNNPALARRYAEGSMVIARLCPTDYHRFHFPCHGVASKPHLINGPLYSVNPMALSKNLSILWENKRFVTEIDSPEFGTVLYVEIGATAVGSVHQTYAFDQAIQKGQEKGYFSFGGSCLVLLFEKGRIQLDADLLSNSRRYLETYAHFGESLGALV